MSLPDLRTPWLKVKVDTGARSSALHAFDLEHFEGPDGPRVRFAVHPWQRSSLDSVTVDAPLVDVRGIRSSSGRLDERPVIRTTLGLGAEAFEIDLTLTRRDEMGFRMLLGREAIRGRFLVDPGRSYLMPKPVKSIRAKNRGRQR